MSINVTFSADQARKHFPSLARKTDNGRVPIYLDNPAGTQVPREVMEAVTDYYMTMNANSGGDFETSRRTDAMVRSVREKMARFLNANQSEEIVFGPNMTTLNFSLSRAIAKTLKAGDEILLTRMDHDANVSPWMLIARDYDLVVRWVDILDDDCTLDLNTLEAALTDRTKVVAAVHASNAVGTINPVKQIGEMAHAAGAYYVVDAVQSAPHIPVDVQAIACDFLLCSAYKFFGPHIGILWGKYELLSSLPAYKVRPSKDKAPYRWETGTPSFETIAGVGAAVDYIESMGGMAAFVPYERELVTHLIDVLKGLDGSRIYGITDPARYDERVPTVAFKLESHTPDEIAKFLAGEDIFVWSGDYYAVEIMNRLGRADEGLVRIGLAHYNTHEEIDRLEQVLKSL